MWLLYSFQSYLVQKNNFQKKLIIKIIEDKMQSLNTPETQELSPKLLPTMTNITANFSILGI
jgi:hypothetical protein